MPVRQHHRLEHELAAAYEQRDIAHAALAAALDALQGLVRFVVREGGYMSHKDQLALGDAKALLVSSGRSIER